MTIVVAGGSGFIGTMLTKRLLAGAHTVVVVDIAPPRFTHEKLFFIQCDITKQQLPFNVLEQTDAVINLAGRTIFGKWNERVKQEIFDSRIMSTRHIVESMKHATNRPTVLINASAVGYYGERANEQLTDRAHQGTGFLADTVVAWEQEAYKAEEFGTRVVCIRTAPVVGHGGLLATIKQSARIGFLLKLTKKEFYQAWIHEDDIVEAYLFALHTSTLQGSVNAAAPEQVTHSIFMHTVGVVMHRRVVGVLPRFIARRMFGEFLEETTKSQCVVPQRLLDKGFVFTYPHLKDAVVAAYKK